ncbi:MAG TPA: helix-turn-helix domain-containing protein [Clostridiaceae bacterium]|nr:helix-turn-helix domain-containing protein [Clostridiaceae bacterium]
MSEQIKQIAARIKDLREISGLSIETLAQEFNVPVETYIEYESGSVDIPVGFLHKISSRFKVDMTALLTGEEPKLRNYCVVRNGKGVSVDRRKAYKYQNLAYNFLHKRAEPFLVTVEPKPDECPLEFNAHPGQEFNYVLEGKLKVVINGYELILDEGDSLYFDSGLEHGMKALNGKPAKFLAIIL